MEKNFKVFCFTVCFFISLSIQTKSQPLRIKHETDICNPDSVTLGRISPDIKGNDLSGLELSIRSLRGAYLCIMVWSSSTKSSQLEYPFFVRLKKLFEGPNIHFLDIATDKDKKDWEFFFRQTADKHLHWYADALKAPLSFYLLKRKDRGEHTYFTYTLPQFILLNPEGRILENKVGFPPSDTTRFDRLIQSLPQKK